MKQITLALLTLYKKLLSPILTGIFGNACRYEPSCSEYAYDAIAKYGVIKGIYLGLKRLSSCHPWSRHDNIYDPVK